MQHQHQHRHHQPHLHPHPHPRDHSHHIIVIIIIILLVVITSMIVAIIFGTIVTRCSPSPSGWKKILGYRGLNNYQYYFGLGFGFRV